MTPSLSSLGHPLLPVSLLLTSCSMSWIQEHFNLPPRLATWAASLMGQSKDMIWSSGSGKESYKSALATPGYLQVLVPLSSFLMGLFYFGQIIFSGTQCRGERGWY